MMTSHFKYGSLCSGIEAASVAWEPLGFEPQWFSEIEPFPCAVLQHHWPHVPNRGDMTRFSEWENNGTIDILIGGTPCQSFSVAGLRKGLDDPRGNLMLTYLAIADQYRPQWLVWENVPGVLSSNCGRDFGTFIGGLGQLGYGFAYRVLDAQYFGVPQRRRRVFVVANLGSWQRATAVLFERESLRWNNPPRRKQGKETTTAAADCFANAGFSDYKPVATAGTLRAKGGPLSGGSENLTLQPIAISGRIIGRKPGNGGNGLGISENGTAPTLTATDIHGVLAFPAELSGTQAAASINVSPALCATGHKMAVAYQLSLASGKKSSGTLLASCATKKWLGNQEAFSGDFFLINNIRKNQIVRRFTPLECERLQGFPDNHTRIPWHGKSAENCPDELRYKAIGNSMAVPVIKWIGQRIKEVSQI